MKIAIVSHCPFPSTSIKQTGFWVIMSPSPATYQLVVRKGQAWQDKLEPQLVSYMLHQLQSTLMDMTSFDLHNSVKQAEKALSHFMEGNNE